MIFKINDVNYVCMMTDIHLQIEKKKDRKKPHNEEIFLLVPTKSKELGFTWFQNETGPSCSKPDYANPRLA